MKLARVLVGGQPRWGIVEEDRIKLLSAAPWQDPKPLGGSIPLEDAQLLPPAEPSKIVCVGLNYR
ncbi:MAG: Rv2993c-like domain-containing protein, partial [Thermoanaerobaculum sp.]